MQLRPHKPGQPRRRAILALITAVMVIGGASTAVALSSVSETPEPVSAGAVGSTGGLSPAGEPLPTKPTATYTPPTTSGPEVSEAAAVAMAAKEARTESTPVTGADTAATQSAASPQAVAHTTRKTATQTIGQGQEPSGASAEVAAWYGGSVYLVSFQGSYVAHDAPVPPGASAPTGHYLTLIVDAYSGKITGYELSETNNLSPKAAAIANGS